MRCAKLKRQPAVGDKICVYPILLHETGGSFHEKFISTILFILFHIDVI